MSSENVYNFGGYKRGHDVLKFIQNEYLSTL